MKIIDFKDASSFLEKSQKALEEDEVNASLILGICENLADKNDIYSKEQVFYSIAYNNKDEISIIGLMTPPRNLLIFEHKTHNNDIMDLFINNIYLKYKEIPGIMGELNITKSFVEKWVQKTNCKNKINMNLRIHKLKKVNEYNKPNGLFRRAEKDDLEIISKYIYEFKVAINEPDSVDIAKESAESGIKNKEIFVWEDKNIVSMARKFRPTKNGVAVSFVYTPKEYQCKGYATAVVSEISQDILDSGKLFCTLYTDLSNPTSNSIYKKIGYNPVCDNISYEFKYK
jgi:predicted GNAT family acetyltransferase